MTSDTMFSGYSVGTYFDEAFADEGEVRTLLRGASEGVRGIRRKTSFSAVAR